VRLVINIVLALCLFQSRTFIPQFFTLDPHVDKLASDAFGVVAWLMWLDGCVTVILGILRGCGQHTRGAAILFVGYYLIGLPLGSCLAFNPPLIESQSSMGLQGL
jgi:MATE family multidrug resistance protein